MHRVALKQQYMPYRFYEGLENFEIEINVMRELLQYLTE